jgi:hypothetical protein
MPSRYAQQHKEAVHFLQMKVHKSHCMMIWMNKNNILHTDINYHLIIKHNNQHMDATCDTGNIKEIGTSFT